MTTVELARQQLLIGGDWTAARSGDTELRWITVQEVPRDYPI